MATTFLLPVLLIVLLAGVVLPIWGIRRVRGRGEGESACGKCGYAVRGLTTSTCPECGADLREVGIVPGVKRGRGAGYAAIAAGAAVWVLLVGLFLLTAEWTMSAPAVRPGPPVTVITTPSTPETGEIGAPPAVEADEIGVPTAVEVGRPEVPE